MSQGVISSELMLFEPKAVNEGVEYLQYIECRPTNQISRRWVSGYPHQSKWVTVLGFAKKSSACEGQNCERGWQQSGRGRCGDTCESVDAKFV